MPIALPARRADLKRFSRAMRSRSPRVVAIGEYYLYYNHVRWLTSETNCSQFLPRMIRRRDVATIERGSANAAAARLAVDGRAHPAVAATLATRRPRARDRRGVGSWHHLQRGHLQDPSPRDFHAFALRRRARQTLHSQHASRR